MEITQYSIEEIKDPTNIIEGKRYELLLDVEFDEEDEIYSEEGIEIRVIIGQKEEEVKILNYFIIDKKDQSYLDFALEDEEEELILKVFREEMINNL